MFYLNKRIIFSKRKLMSGFKVLLNSVNVLEYKLGMNLGMPGGTSLYSPFQLKSALKGKISQIGATLQEFLVLRLYFRHTKTQNAAELRKREKLTAFFLNVF